MIGILENEKSRHPCIIENCNPDNSLLADENSERIGGTLRASLVIPEKDEKSTVKNLNSDLIHGIEKTYLDVFSYSDPPDGGHQGN